MTTVLRYGILSVVLSVVLAGSAIAAPLNSYSYTLDVGVSGGNGGLQGTAFWGAGPTSLQWIVTRQTAADPWHYKYVFNFPRVDISHVVVETSPGFTLGDLDNANWPKLEHDDSWSTGQGNPFMPGEIGGVKFDETSGTSDVVFEFDSWRVPVWGDFYAKGGGQITNTVWNLGYAPNETAGAGNDPVVAPYDGGSEAFHILVPDTTTTGGNDPLPEPATMLSLGVAGMGLMRYLGRRRG